jgi:hypothetical protein
MSLDYEGAAALSLVAELLGEDLAVDFGKLAGGLGS